MPCPPHDACLSWQAVTQLVDNTQITGPVTYRIYRNGVPVATTATLTLQLVNEPAGNQCYRGVVVLSDRESDMSNEVCKFIRLEAPTNGGIE